MPHLSIIILSYNTKKITQGCLDSLYQSLFPTGEKRNMYEIIVIDNGSSDGSRDMLLEWEKTHRGLYCIVKTVLNTQNIGYPAGNNQGLRLAQGRYVLFANSDIIWNAISFENILSYLDKNQRVGVLTIKVVLKNGEIDLASHRGFPTIWNSFTYFFKLEKLFSRIPIIGKLFGGYHLTYLDMSTTHEIDSPAGAFYLSRKDILTRVGGFDEQFFMYGEDLDLSFRIKKLGYSIVYYPRYSVTHLKYASGLKRDNDQIKNKTKHYFFDAMEIFYRKHYERQTPFFINKLIQFTIYLKRKFS